MRFFLVLLLGLFSIGGAAQSTDTVVRAARIVDGKGGVLANGAVTIREGRIVSVGQIGRAHV